MIPRIAVLLSTFGLDYHEIPFYKYHRVLLPGKYPEVLVRRVPQSDIEFRGRT